MNSALTVPNGARMDFGTGGNFAFSNSTFSSITSVCWGPGVCLTPSDVLAIKAHVASVEVRPTDDPPLFLTPLDAWVRAVVVFALVAVSYTLGYKRVRLSLVSGRKK